MILSNLLIPCQSHKVHLKRMHTQHTLQHTHTHTHTQHTHNTHTTTHTHTTHNTHTHTHTDTQHNTTHTTQHTNVTHTQCGDDVASHTTFCVTSTLKIEENVKSHQANFVTQQEFFYIMLNYFCPVGRSQNFNWYKILFILKFSKLKNVPNSPCAHFSPFLAHFSSV